MTWYILQKGGDINFRFNWGDNPFLGLCLGIGNNVGTALDFVSDIKNKNPDSRNVTKMIELLSQVISLLSNNSIHKNTGTN